DEISSTDDPDVSPARGLTHLGMHRNDVAAHETYVRGGKDSQIAVREDPAGNVVRPLPVGRILVRELVIEDPFVRRRAHRDRSYMLDELAVVERSIPILLPREEPLERMVLVRDEAVERGSRVVLGETHRESLPTQSPRRARSQSPTALPTACTSAFKPWSPGTRITERPGPGGGMPKGSRSP